MDNLKKLVSFWNFGVRLVFRAIHFTLKCIQKAFEVKWLKIHLAKKVKTSKRLNIIHKKLVSLVSKWSHETSETRPTKLVSLVSLLLSSETSETSGRQAQMRVNVQWDFIVRMRLFCKRVSWEGQSDGI